MSIARPKQFRLFLSEKEKRTMERLARRDGLSSSDYLRQLIHRDAKRKASAR